MWRITRRELADAWRVWWPTATAIVLATVVCGCAAVARTAIGGVSQDAAEATTSFATMVLACTLVAAFSAVAAAVDLAVSACRRRLALLMLSGLTPGQGMLLVYIQCAAVAAPAVGVGGLVAWACSGSTTPLIVRGAGLPVGQVQGVAWAIGLSCVLVMMTALIAATRGARQARDVCALEVLRQIEPPPPRRSRIRRLVVVFAAIWLIGAVLLAIGGGFVSKIIASNTEPGTWTPSVADSAVSGGFLACIALTALLAATAPSWAPRLMRIIGAMTRHFSPPSWRIASHFAREHANRSTTAITLITIAATLSGGLFSVFHTGAAALVAMGQAESATVNTASLLTMLAGPFLVALTGGALSAVVTLRDRLSELTTVQLAGATPRQSISIPLLEIAANAFVAAIVSAAASGALACLVAAGFMGEVLVLPHITVLPIVIVCAIGAALLSVAILPSLWRDHARPAVKRLAVE